MENTNLSKSVPNAKKPKKDRQPSTLFTIKSFANVINKMHRMRMITEAEQKTLSDLHSTVTARWIGLQLNKQ